MSDMNVQVTISADASSVGTAVQKGKADLSGFTAAAKEMTSALQAGFAQLSALSEKMNATMQDGFAQTGFVLRSMASEMGEVREAATTELPKVVPEVEKIEKATKKAEFGLGTLGQKLASVGMAMSLAFTAPTVAATAGIFEATKSMDSMKLSLTAVAGSAEGMKRQLADAQEIAKLPGLGMEEAVNGKIRLQAAGVAADQTNKFLMATGNALATVGKGKADLEGVTLAFSQIQSKGKVFAEEINQINERLPQIRGAMKAAFGTDSSEELQNLGVSSEEFISKITTEFAKLPSVAGGLQNDMENLSDRWKNALTDMGEGLKPFFSTALQVFMAVAGKVAELGKWFGSLTENQRTWIVSAVGVAAAIGPVLLGAGKAIAIMVELKEAFVVARTAMIEMNLTMLANPFVDAAAAIVGVTLAVMGLKSAMDDLANSDIEKNAARSPEALAAKKKVESYQYAFDHLSAGKERDEVGRKLGRAKEEMNAAFAKDDATIKNGTTFDMGTGGADGSATFDVKKALAARGVFERNAKPEKAKKTTQEWSPEIQMMEREFKVRQQTEEESKKSIASLEAQKRHELKLTNDAIKDAQIKHAGYINDMAKSECALAEAKKTAAHEATVARQNEVKSWLSGFASVTSSVNQGLINMGKKHHTFRGEINAMWDSITENAIMEGLKLSQAWLGRLLVEQWSAKAAAAENVATKQAEAAALQVVAAEANVAAVAQGTVTGMALAQAYATPAALAATMSFGGAAVSGGAALATTVAAAHALPSFAVGTPSVPRDMVAQIHKGERIVPAEENWSGGHHDGPGKAKGSGGSNHSASLVLPDDILAAIASKGSALVKIIDNQGRLSFS